jgi:hypothetical protein
MTTDWASLIGVHFQQSEFVEVNKVSDGPAGSMRAPPAAATRRVFAESGNLCAAMPDRLPNEPMRLVITP